MKIKFTIFILCFFVVSFMGCTSTYIRGIEEIDGYKCYRIGYEVPEELKDYQKVLVYGTCISYLGLIPIGYKDTYILCTIYNNRFTRLQVWHTRQENYSATSTYYDDRYGYGDKTYTNINGPSYETLDDLVGPMTYKYIVAVYK